MANIKGIKQVSDIEFDQICELFAVNSRTKAMRYVRPIVRQRKNQRIYQSGRDMGLRGDQVFKAIAAGGFSIVGTTPVTQPEVDAWIGSRNGTQKA